MFDFGSGLSLTKNTDALRSTKSLNTIFLEDIPEVPFEEEGASDIDRGWAFVIFPASFLGHIIVFGVPQSSGVIYTAILDYDFEASDALVSLPFAFTISLVYILSPLSNWCQSYLGSRITILIGCLLSSGGLIAASFVYTAVQLVVTLGIMCGVGWALVYTVLVKHLENFFVVYRKTVTMGVSIGTGISSFVYPFILDALTMRFGWRGTLFIAGALNLNLLVCVASFKVNKFAEKLREEEERGERRQSTVQSTGSLFVQKSDSSRKNGASSDSPVRYPTVRFTVPAKPKNTCFRRLNAFLDDNSCLNMRFQLVVIAHFFLTMAAAACVIQLSNYVVSLGYTSSTAALLVSIYGLSSSINRVLLAVIAYFFPESICALFELVVFGFGLFSLFTGFSTSFISLLILSICLGMSNSWFIMTPEIIFLTVGHVRFNKAFSLVLLSCGIGSLIAPPISALIFQMTASYAYTFIFVGFSAILGGFCIIPILIEYSRHCCDCDF